MYLVTQLLLSKVDRLNGGQTETVSRFTPMNLIWSNTEQLPAKDRVTRSVLLADTPPVYCDLGLEPKIIRVDSTI
jgi:hypothetical protein